MGGLNCKEIFLNVEEVEIEVGHQVWALSTQMLSGEDWGRAYDFCRFYG